MNLLRLSLKNIFGKKTLFLGTVLSVVMAVSFVVGVFITTDSMRAAFGNLAEEIAGQIDLRVRTKNPFGDRLNAPTVDPAIVEEVREVDGVLAADGQVFAFIAGLLIDGEPVSSSNAPTIAQSWPEEGTVSTLTLVDGRKPVKGEFTLDTGTFDNQGLVIGDTYEVSLPGGTRELILSGTMFFGTDEENVFGAQILGFSLESSTELLNDGEGWNEILVNVESGYDTESVREAIAGILNQDTIEVITVEEAADEQRENFNSFLNIFQNILLAFALITLVVSAFLVNNVFSIITGQRIRELGLLRALGATGNQISRMVLGESAAVGVLATGLGLAGGIGISALLRLVFNTQGGNLPIDPTSLASRTILVAVAVGVGATILAALSPAFKARSVTPMAAISEEVRLGEARPRRRPLVGTTLLAAAIVLLIAGLWVRDWQGLILFSLLSSCAAFFGGRRLAPWVGRLSMLAVAAVLLVAPAVAEWSTTKLLVSLSIGALMAFVGINMTSPMFARPLALGLGKPFAVADGITGELSRQNASRSPRRTSTTAAALMIGLALVVTVGIVAASMRATFTEVIDEQISADWFMSGSGNNENGTIGPQFAEDLAVLPETRSVASYRFQSGAFRTGDDEVHALMATNASEIGQHLDLDLIAGTVEDLPPNGVLVSQDTAVSLNLNPGDDVEAELVDGRSVTWKVAGIYEDEAIVGSWLTSLTSFSRYFPFVNQDLYVSVLTAEGVSEEDAREAIEKVAEPFPLVEVRTKAEFRDSQTNQINQALLFVNIFLGLALVIAILGIVATLALSVFERTRELGLLRAVGMTAGQLRRMVCWEGVIVAVFGGLLGTALGVVFGTLTTRIIPDSVVNTLQFPVGQLILYLVLAGVAGLASGVLPAIWAGRMKVLDAISYE